MDNSELVLCYVLKGELHVPVIQETDSLVSLSEEVLR